MFNKLFNVNNPFWKSMDTVFDLFILNALLLFCSIPIFTIGPALSAFHFTLIQKSLGEEGTVFNDFFRSFKRNFKQGVFLGLPMTLVGAFLIFDIYLCRKMGTGIYSFFTFFFLVILIFWFFILLYLFPLLGKFEGTNRELLIWAFTLSVSKLPYTFLMSLVTVACLWICRIIPGLIFIIFGLIGQFQAPILTSIFKPYIEANEKKQQAEAENDTETTSVENGE